MSEILLGAIFALFAITMIGLIAVALVVIPLWAAELILS
jgi:hypothetical protein